MNGGYEPLKRRLLRSQSDRMLAGVAGGMGEYFDMDPTVVRLAWLVLGVLTAVVPTLVLYAAAAVVIPREDTVV